MGSTRIARSAGMTLASSATNDSTSGTATNVSRIARLHLVEKGRHHAGADERCDQADDHALERQPEAAPDDEPEDR